MRRFGLLALPLAFLVTLNARADPTPDEWNTVVDKAIEFLKSTQNSDGSWGPDSPQKRGVTGIVVTGLLKTGKLTADDPAVAKGLKYIESLVNVKDGHIAGADAKVNLHNYVTSINVMALQAADKPEKYKAIVGDAVKFLKQLQWDEGEMKKQEDDFFGGAGYDSKSRPDLSNTHFFLDALKDSGISADDPALKKALVFVSRCQNLKSEANDQPWADKINDGSFIYSAAGGGSTRALDDPKAPLIGYGSMTYAGIKSMIYAGLTKDDPRVQAAFDWITKNWTLDINPGMQLANAAQAQHGLYYYYNVFAQALNVMDQPVITDAKGAKHEWRSELVQKLAALQKPDGSWVGDARWMENDPILVTAYAVLALQQVKDDLTTSAISPEKPKGK
jgi:squalene-hopene/tetraprenyl-beta-curcumene cyclase